MGEPRTVAEDIREATRDAHAALKDLRALLREAESLRKRVFDGIERAVEDEIGAKIREGLAEYGDTLTKAIDEGTEKALKRFDTLSNLLLHGNQQGRGPDLVEQYVRHVVRAEILGVIREAAEHGDPQQLLRDVARSAS